MFTALHGCAFILRLLIKYLHSRYLDRVAFTIDTNYLMVFCTE